jgi:DNA-directed RNA polymerase specialized sigma24 family protein
MNTSTPRTDASPTGEPGRFAPTRWTLVLRARGDSAAARTALSELCEAYYAPVQAFIQRTESNPENARDLTQSFFAELLGGRGMATVDPNRGRFRSYLLGAVKHFLAESHRKAVAAKRGGGISLISLTVGSSNETTSELRVPDPSGPPPDSLFDHDWAATLVDRAAAVLAAEYATADKADQFTVLKPWLLGDVPTISQAEVARMLGLSDGAVKVAIHRMRKRFRELVRSEIVQTVNDASQAREELRYLVEVLSQPATK